MLRATLGRKIGSTAQDWHSGRELMGLFKKMRETTPDETADPGNEGVEADHAGQTGETRQPGQPGQPGEAEPAGRANATGSDGVTSRLVANVEESRKAISRRGFLGGTAAVGGAALGEYFFQGPAGRVWPKPKTLGMDATTATSATSLAHALESVPTGESIPTLVPDLTFSIDRDTDMVQLDFFFYGFAINRAGSVPAIVPTTWPNYVVVRFPPQAIGEGAYLSPQPAPTPSNPNPNPTGLVFDPAPILSAVAGSSQLCFTLSTSQSIPLPTMTASDLLDWSGWGLNVMPVAEVNPPVPNAAGLPQYPLPSRPGILDSFIEFPYSLYLSPTTFGSGPFVAEFVTGFTNRTAPLVSPANVVDVFRTSLWRDDVFVSPSSPPLVSAIWSRDFTSYAPTRSVQNHTPESFIFYGVPIT